MNESNKPDGEWSLRRRWREVNASRHKWDRRCGAIGLLTLLGGLGGCTVSHTLYVKQYSPTLVGTLDL
ncbi:MAG: hypothetical protein AAF456_14615 [Planctomycetota bacterium]